MLRGVALAGLVLALSTCSKMGPLANFDAGSSSSLWPGMPGAASALPVAASESQPAAPPPPPAASMPPRPVPKSSPTVAITMPLEVQLKAIQYMASMQAPRPDDSPADEAYAQSIAAQLRAVGRTDVVAGGRQIRHSDGQAVHRRLSEGRHRPPYRGIVAVDSPDARSARRTVLGSHAPVPSEHSRCG